MTAAVAVACVAIALAVLAILAAWGICLLAPKGQHHGTCTPPAPAPVPPPWPVHPEPVQPLTWDPHIAVPLPDMEVIRRQGEIAKQVRAGRVVDSLAPSPWGDSTGSFAAITARDLGTPGGPS